MASDEERGYEIEFVQEGRVSKKKGKLFWEFKVRWKGYGADEDTWEPVKSFQQRETLDAFWERTRDPRDMNDLSKFRVGETFVPLGPPRRRKPKTTKTESAEVAESSNQATTPPPPGTPKASSSKSHESPESLGISDLRTGKRRRGPLDVTPKQPPEKRMREDGPSSTNGKKSTRISARRNTVSSASTKNIASPLKKAREPSPEEVVPASDEEAEVAMIIEQNRSVSSEPPTVPPSPPACDAPEDPLFDENHPDNKLPAHRLRAKNPRVKAYEDPAVAVPEGQLSAKARATRQKAAGSSAGTKSKAATTRSSGPKNRASLLTASGGKLKTLKGSYKAPQPEPEVEPEVIDLSQGDDDRPVEPPTGQELLAEAGLNPADAEALPDFEDAGDEAEPQISSPVSKEDEKAQALTQERQDSLLKAKESLFPSAAASQSESRPAWGPSTIFGPLSIGGSSTTHTADANATSQQTASFSLNLDASTILPVVFSNIVPADGALVPKFQVSYHGPPGQFYSRVAAPVVLDAVRSLGIAGRVRVKEDVSAEEKAQFSLFSNRLQDGELFVMTAGFDFYAFCSSDSRSLCSRMNISPGLQIAEKNVLVCKIAVDNASGYAEAVLKADPRRWPDYVAQASSQG